MLNTIKRLIMEATETPEDIRKKLYPNIKQDIFTKIISADPTSSESKMGKYSNWLLNLYKEGNLKLEDLYKATEYLTAYNEDPKKYPKLYNIKDLPMLYTVLQQKSGVERQVQDYSDISKDKGAEILYRDSEWILLSPKTQEASCKYGAGTQWCTAATRSGNMFNEYNEQGDLYILIDRKNNRKWQFHFETSQFNDETDKKVDYSEIKRIYGLLPSELAEKIDNLASNDILISLDNEDEFGLYYGITNDLSKIFGGWGGVDIDRFKFDKDGDFYDMFTMIFPNKNYFKYVTNIELLDSDLEETGEEYEELAIKEYVSDNENLYSKLERMYKYAYVEIIQDTINEELKNLGLSFEEGLLYSTADSLLEFFKPKPEFDPNSYLFVGVKYLIKDVREVMKRLYK